jgi:DNA-binding PadR family transcriptional regulator
MFGPGCGAHHRAFRRGMSFGRHMEDEVRTRRGDIKYLLLTLLAERPRHGYDLIKELETRNAGFYRPSAGSIYPTLQMLEEGGFLTSEMVEGKRVYTITEAGKKLLSEREGQERGAGSRSDSRASARERWNRLAELRKVAVELGGAVMQVARHGDSARVDKVEEILDRARREIYAILSEGK